MALMILGFANTVFATGDADTPDNPAPNCRFMLMNQTELRAEIRRLSASSENISEEDDGQALVSELLAAGNVLIMYSSYADSEVLATFAAIRKLKERTAWLSAVHPAVRGEKIVASYSSGDMGALNTHFSSAAAELFEVHRPNKTQVPMAYITVLKVQVQAGHHGKFLTNFHNKVFMPKASAFESVAGRDRFKAELQPLIKDLNNDADSSSFTAVFISLPTDGTLLDELDPSHAGIIVQYSAYPDYLRDAFIHPEILLLPRILQIVGLRVDGS